MKNSLERARSNMLAVQGRMTITANRYKRPMDFDINDLVYISTKYLNTGKLSRKFDNQQDGPYLIFERVGHSFKLDLPFSLKIYPVISLDKLRKDPNDPLPRQINDPSAPINIIGDDE